MSSRQTDSSNTNIIIWVVLAITPVCSILSVVGQSRKGAVGGNFDRESTTSGSGYRYLELGFFNKGKVTYNSKNSPSGGGN